MGLEQQLQNQVPDLMDDDLFGEDPALQHWKSKLASDEARWVTGVILPVDSGVLSVTPLLMAGHLRAVPEP